MINGQRASKSKIATIVLVLAVVVLISLTAVEKLNRYKTVNSWIQVLGGLDEEWAFGVEQTADGGYVLVGYTNKTKLRDYDVLVVKLNSSGGVEWAEALGGGKDDGAFSVEQTADGGYVLAGISHSFGAGGSDVLVIKLNSTGGVQWAETIGGKGDDGAFSVEQTADGGYVLAGNTFSTNRYSSVLVIKLNSTGGVQWAEALGGDGCFSVFCIKQTSDGGYVLVGYTNKTKLRDYDVLVVKLNSSGGVEWAEALGGDGNDFCRDIKQTADGGYVLAGTTRSSGFGDKDVLVVKLNSTGGVQWAEAVGGSGGEEGLRVDLSPRGDYFVIGYVADVFGAGYDDILVIKLNSTGGVQWAETIGGKGDDEAFDSCQAYDGGYVVAGYTTSFSVGGGGRNMLLIKTASDFNLKDCPLVKRIPLNSSKNLPPKLRVLIQFYAERVKFHSHYVKLEIKAPRFTVRHVVLSVAKLSLANKCIYVRKD